MNSRDFRNIREAKKILKNIKKKEQDDKEFRLYMDKNANAMSRFLKELNDFTEDANDDYKGAYGNTPSTTVIKQLESMLDEMRKLLKQRG